jgi:dTDP-4-amino-4,6-dideoxygalactose transaminase
MHTSPLRVWARPEFGPWPYFEADERDAALRVLTSGNVNYWTGRECRDFETEYANKIGVKHAVALANGTVALELALRALGLGPGDEVIVTPRSFIASVSCAVILGCMPVFVDVDGDSQNMTASTIEAKITKKTRAIIAVHLAGWPCEMDPIFDLAARHDIAVIEDCAQAHGSCYKGRPSGSMGRINAFSFCQDKIMTTAGEGGMITTDDEELWAKSWSFKDHGKSWKAVYGRKHPVGFRWLHEDFGTNWRMLELQGAMGRICLRKLDRWVEARRANADILNGRFAPLAAIRLTLPPAHIYHSYYKYYAFVRPEALRSDWSRDRIISELNQEGVPAFSGTCGEIYREKAFQNYEFGEMRLPVARALAETSVMLMVHPTLSPETMHYTADSLSRIVSRATR